MRMLKSTKRWLGGTRRAPEELSQLNDAFIARRLANSRVEHKAPESAVLDTRTSPRLVPDVNFTSLTATSGKRYDARIINVSMHAVALEADFASIDPGQVTKVGSRLVTKGRKIMGGMVFLFDKPISEDTFGATLIL